MRVSLYLCIAKPTQNAEIAQLVEHDLAKVGVAGPSPVFRSRKSSRTCFTVWDFFYQNVHRIV